MPSNMRRLQKDVLLPATKEQGKAAQSNRQEVLCASVALGVNSELTWKGPLVGYPLGVPLLFPLQVQKTRLTQEKRQCPFHSTKDRAMHLQVQDPEVSMQGHWERHRGLSSLW